MDESDRVVHADRGITRRLVHVDLFFRANETAIARVAGRRFQEVQAPAARLHPVAVVVSPRPTSNETRRRVNHLLANLPTILGRDIQIVHQPRRLDLVIRVGTTTTWLDVANVEGAERFPIVRLPRLLMSDTPPVVIVPINSHTDQIGPIEALAALSHPRQAIAARLDRRRQGIAAELAAPIVPGLIVLIVEHASHRFVATTNDRIAAELLTTALRQDTVGDNEQIGPWEDSIVQRATQLDLGVRLPSDVVLTSWEPRTEMASGAESRERLVKRLRLRLGISSG